MFNFMAMNRINKSFEYYRANKDTFCNLYDGKYIVIKGQEIIGVFDKYDEAYQKSMKANANCIIEHPILRK